MTLLYAILASPGWAHSTWFFPPLWGSAHSIVTGPLDLSLHNPQRQKPCFVYFCVFHNPWHVIGIQMFAWMDESVNKWTDFPLPGTRSLFLVLSLLWTALCPRQCLQAWAWKYLPWKQMTNRSSPPNFTFPWLFRETLQESHGPLRGPGSYSPSHILFITVPLSLKGQLWAPLLESLSAGIPPLTTTNTNNNLSPR